MVLLRKVLETENFGNYKKNLDLNCGEKYKIEQNEKDNKKEKWIDQ